MSKSKVGIMIVDGKEFNTFTAMCEKYMGTSNKSVVYDFMRTLTKLDIFKKESRRCKERVHYNYILNDWFADLMKNQYVIGGSEKSKKFYFDDDASKTLVQIYQEFKNEEPDFKEWGSMVIRITEQARGQQKAGVTRRELEDMKEMLESFQTALKTSLVLVEESLKKLNKY